MSIWLDNCPVLTTSKKGRISCGPFLLSVNILCNQIPVRYSLNAFVNIPKSLKASSEDISLPDDKRS